MVVVIIAKVLRSSPWLAKRLLTVARQTARLSSPNSFIFRGPPQSELLGSSAFPLFHLRGEIVIYWSDFRVSVRRGELARVMINRLLASDARFLSSGSAERKCHKSPANSLLIARGEIQIININSECLPVTMLTNTFFLQSAGTSRHGSLRGKRAADDISPPTRVLVCCGCLRPRHTASSNWLLILPAFGS